MFLLHRKGQSLFTWKLRWDTNGDHSNWEHTSMGNGESLYIAILADIYDTIYIIAITYRIITIFI